MPLLGCPCRPEAALLFCRFLAQRTSALGGDFPHHPKTAGSVAAIPALWVSRGSCVPTRHEGSSVPS